ncbi:MAG: hypothetical protein ABIQ40_00590 [Bacteroidia bacterium]
MSKRKTKIYRIVASYLALNLLAQICMPMTALALTNGPGQPEFQSFEPAGTTDMVNLFTGDFNYNIPLMTVPGPNGGYPINMAYHAGIGMEQEASWVGLGWNINAGAINRSMRGIPDDFNGENILKTLHYKPNTSVDLSFGTSILAKYFDKEFLGFKLASAQADMHVYYNNYRGLGYKFGIGINTNGTGDPYAPSFGLNLSASSDGVGVNVDYTTVKKGVYFGSGLTWGDHEGLKGLSLASGKVSKSWGSLSSFQASFAKSSYVPSSSPEMTGLIVMLGFKLGKDKYFTVPPKKLTSINGSFSRSWVKNEIENIPAYGYINSQNAPAISGGHCLEDINREKEIPPTRQIKTLEVPVPTYDVYSVSGQGVGGAFRPYRSDMGIYTEPNVTSKIRGGDVSVEFGTDSGHVCISNKLGADLAYIQSTTYSGAWKNQWWEDYTNGGGYDAIGNDYHFFGSTSDPLYEPYYFKMSGEQTAAPADQLNFIGGDSPEHFRLKEVFGHTDFPFARPEILTDKLYQSEHASGFDLDESKNHRTTREKRVVSNQQRTNAELGALGSDAPSYYASSAGINSFPVLGGSASTSTYNYNAHNGNQIGAFTEVNPDGNRYVYGIPVYTNSKDAFFAIANDAADGTYPENYLKSFTTTQGSKDNNEAHTDQLYSSKELPGYADSYLLTAIYSPDYVDLTGDGPSEDDLGYYVKFNYVKAYSNYQWRAPYKDGIFNTGYLSDPTDNKISYAYGEKEVYYMHSIETKTHVACFFLNNNNNDLTERKDSHAAFSEFPQTFNSTPVTNSQKLWALDSICLYSKADSHYGSSAAIPLKSVHFTYNYSLCSGVYNNENIEHGGDGTTGKLTLVSVYFTYLNNSKGKLSPYKFDYIDPSASADLKNPGYDPEGNDRWGNYKKQEHPTWPFPAKYLNKENPYVDQLYADSERVSQSAAAWSLKKITLPSGSEINIQYEADDYAYVQDKPAMQMCRVVGTADGSVCTDALSDIGSGLGKTHTRIYFELNKPIPSSTTTPDKKALVKKYIENIDPMYFKMFVVLKKADGLSGPDLFDYVDGYCTLNMDDGYYGVVNESSGSDRFGYVTVNTVDRDDYPGTNVHNVNPIRKAAWQYIYLNRPDLFAPTTLGSSITDIVSAAVAMIGEIPRAIAPYVTASARGWGDRMDINTGTYDCDIRPSYIRLNSPDGIKAGGGHRVSRITINDNWDDLSGGGLTAIYGQKYTYRLVDGKSSGVASYEPMIGGEEIPLRLPIRYNSDNLVKKDNAFYVEEPMGESYYPAPVVGYSRVIVESIVGDIDINNPTVHHENQDAEPVDPANPTAPTSYVDIIKSRTGKTVYEFYTAKDYPVVATRTELQKTWFPMPIFVPFIGNITYNNRGFAQGYSVVLNDMHGKLKAVSTYPYSADLTSSRPIPVRRVVYKYNGGYTEGKANHLSSTVTVLTQDGITEQANLGETYDFFTDMQQHSNETADLGAQFNFEVGTKYPFIIPVLLPKINIARSLYRSAVTMKVIYRTGILTDVETIDDGAKSTARNLMFDAETGAPLLTSVTNEFEKPVYTYNYAAHWAYDGMNGAYKNIGVSYNGMSTDASGNATVTNAQNIFFQGDEIMFEPSLGTALMLWVDVVGTGNVHFIKADGTSADGLTGSFTIIRSGYRNQQSSSNGVIVSLDNPVTNRSFPLFDYLNSHNPLAPMEYELQDCQGVYNSFTLELDEVTNSLLITRVFPQTCAGASVIFPDSFHPENLSDLNGAHFTPIGNHIQITLGDNSIINATWSDPKHCFPACFPDVLHAAATRFADNWAAASTDGSQQINFSDAGLTDANVPSVHNPYLFAEKGVWRTQSNYLYQVDRRQSGASRSSTNIGIDGLYENFTPYVWTQDADLNEKWAFVSRITRYSPFGFALESSDALGIFSSTMYGYENTKQTAAASNCQYFELAFDGFEDYPSGAYPQTLLTTSGTTAWGHGHLLFLPPGDGSAAEITDTLAHTGKYSFKTTFSNDAWYRITSVNGVYPNNQQYFEPQPGQKYNLSVWVRATGGGIPAVVINNGSTTQTFTPDLAQSAIEGWKRIDVKFTAPLSGNTLSIMLKCQISGAAYFDDIRIQPFKSAMVSNVYDPHTHWLLATLDNRNFATFYNYDEEGSLVQVKQETEKGIFTIKTSRSNIKR